MSSEDCFTLSGQRGDVCSEGMSHLPAVTMRDMPSRGGDSVTDSGYDTLASRNSYGVMSNSPSSMTRPGSSVSTTVSHRIR